ncbi:hypothetical protein IWW38_006412, partial [Coemansia aciculifera]
MARKTSMASLVSSAQSELHPSSLRSAEEEEEEGEEDTELASTVSKPIATGSAIPVASQSTGYGETQGGSAKRSTDLKADKRKVKDDEKANRRQSIKNQRSLPAMFGIGLKSKGESKHAPPVPQLP